MAGFSQPRIAVDLGPYFKGEERSHHEKTLIVLHETVSHNREGTGDITGVAGFMDSTGLEIHGIVDIEGNVAWCNDPEAVYDHAASGSGNVNTRSIGFELVSEIPLEKSKARRKEMWADESRRTQLDTVAAWCAWLSTQHRIPLRFSQGDRPGITTHWNVTRTYLDGNGHWDCWPTHQDGHFPALYVVRKAQQLLKQPELLSQPEPPDADVSPRRRKTMALKIVGRKEWGARSPRRVTRRKPSDLAGVAVHWFGKPSAAKSHDGCAALLRGVQATHMAPGGLGTKDGANDIGYNHAVCPHGVAFELRGFGVQTGANGTASANEEYAAIVYMAGTGDVLTDEAAGVLAELIRMWQAQGAGPLVKPHQFFVQTDCPGPDLLEWIELQPPPWQGKKAARPVPVEDETPAWLMDFVLWRLTQSADPKLRPKTLPKKIPDSAWEAAALVEQMAGVMGPQQPFLDWVEWRRQGASRETRPRTVPRKIPKSWPEALGRLEQSFGGGELEPPTTRPKPKPAEDQPPPVETLVTTQTELLSPPRSTQAALGRYMLARKHGTYSDAEVRDIVKKYVTTAKAVGLDPLLVVSQMVLETGSLTSDWSQPPRRNPAGIGVTGQPGAGISFPSWDEAVRAHVGRLLAYALPKGKGDADQRALISEALTVRPLPDNRRGCAPTLEGLAGTWATDKGYAGKIARVANEMAKA